MPVPDRDRRKRVEAILSEPDLYPDEFKAWVPRMLEGNPNFRIASLQLPIVEPTRYVGDSGQPAFENSWVNYGSGYEAAGYYKDPFGIVHLCGLVKNGTLSTAVFTLPGGYRPKAREMFEKIQGTSTAERFDVLATGSVLPQGASNAYVSLSGITFRAYG